MALLTLAYIVLLGCRVIYGAVFVANGIRIYASRRAQPESESEQKFVPAANVGTALGLGFFWLVWRGSRAKRHLQDF